MFKTLFEIKKRVEKSYTYFSGALMSLAIPETVDYVMWTELKKIFCPIKEVTNYTEMRD